MVITTMGQINFYDGQRFSYINTAEENLYPLSNYSGNYHQYFDKYHHLWLKNKHNVTCVNLTTETFVNSIKDEFSKFGIEKPVQDIFVDDDHIVWLLTEDGLYNVESKKTQQIRRDLNLQDLDVYDKDQLMLFYDNGLLEIIDLKTEKKVYEGRARKCMKVAPMMKKTCCDMTGVRYCCEIRMCSTRSGTVPKKLYSTCLI